MIFYFDEAFHDKAITFKNHRLNLEKDNVEEFYIGCYIGSDEWEDIEKECIELEKRHLKTLGSNTNAELKSTALIKMSKLQYGLASLSNRSFDFYKELFEILSGRVKIHFSVLNKYEYLLRESLPYKEWFEERGVLYDRFIYSFTKFMILHPEYDFPNIIFSKKNNKWKIKEILSILHGHMEKIKEIHKKKHEIMMLDQMIQIVGNPDFYFHAIPEKLHWRYDLSPELFSLYCSEIGSMPDKIIVDEETDTVNAMKETFQCEVSGENSKLNIRIRVCDWVAGFFSRMLLSYDNDYKNDKENDLTENIHFLDDQAFRSDEEFIGFMDLLYDLFITQQETYWATGSLAYGDQIICFYTFLQYYKSCLTNNETANPEGFNLELSNVMRERFLDEEF